DDLALEDRLAALRTNRPISAEPLASRGGAARTGRRDGESSHTNARARATVDARAGAPRGVQGPSSASRARGGIRGASALGPERTRASSMSTPRGSAWGPLAAKEVLSRAGHHVTEKESYKDGARRLEVERQGWRGTLYFDDWPRSARASLRRL